MCRQILISMGVAGATLLFASAGVAQLPPAPPVGQTLGMPDIAASELVEADCRVCHDSGVRDRHHILYGQPIPPGTVVPFPDVDRNGQPDTVYGCLSCHGTRFTVIRDCVVCHTESAHHSTPAALSGDCVSCHGDIVDNMDDGHYIPNFATSARTPQPSDGTGLPLNDRGNGAGACNYCHDDDGMAVPFILTNRNLHHEASSNCLWCHPIHVTPAKIRVCEGCHGPESLHNIQTDSPNPANLGTIVFGQEDPGYGHVGADSDCWGCHGYSQAATMQFGPMVPTIYNSDRKVLRSGEGGMVILNGAAFRDITNGIPSESEVSVTAADGSSVTLTPDAVADDGILVTIPGSTPPGNYDLKAVKAGVTSNPAVVSVIPEVNITGATFDGKVTIRGEGFAGYAKGSGTSVTRTRSWGWGRWARTTAEEGKVLSWNDTKIEVDFGATPKNVTVNTVFGQATARVRQTKSGATAAAQSSSLIFGGASTSGKPVKPVRGRRFSWWWW